MTKAEYIAKRYEMKMKTFSKILKFWHKYYKPEYKPMVYIDKIKKETGYSRQTIYEAVRFEQAQKNNVA